MESIENALEKILQDESITTETLAVAAMRAELVRRGKRISPPRGVDAKLANILLKHGIVENPRAIRSLIDKLEEIRSTSSNG